MILAHLSSTEATGLHVNEPIAQFEIGAYRNFVYLILDWKTRAAAIVDPQKDLSVPLDALSRHGFSLNAILLTHTHHDHIAGVPELLRAFPDVSLGVHAGDLHRLDPRMTATVRDAGCLRLLEDGDCVAVGQLSLEILHTPGHSAGECCFFLPGEPGYLLTGDTLFIRDCGRTDLESGSTTQMFESLQRIKGLPASTVILPGHHYARECASSLEREIRESPPLRCLSAEELEALP